MCKDINLALVFTLKEASELYDIDPSTLRHAIKYNRFEKHEIKKSGGTWLIIKPAMDRLYKKSE